MTAQNERPKIATAEMREESAKEIVAELINCGHIDASVEQESILDLSRVSWRDDGYEIAKELDDRYRWDCCMEMIETLDNFGYSVRKNIEAAQKVWAEQNNIQPPFPIGTHVKHRDETGVITGIYEYGAAQYLIAKDGDPSAHTETQRRQIVNFEDVKQTSNNEIRK